MHYKILILSILAPIFAIAQGRVLQYTPDTDNYISCVNGNNRYTRAIYGTHTLWRLETSDRPIFGAYHKKDNRSIYFTVEAKGRSLRLDSLSHCTSKYKGGRRVYTLTDERLGNKAQIVMSVLALADDEGAIWHINATDMPKGATITAHCCAPVEVKMSRSGDMGVDPKNCFDPHPDLLGHQQCSVPMGGKKADAFILYRDREVTSGNQMQLSSVYDAAHAKWQQGIDRISVITPDPYINILGWTLTTAGDGIWDGTSYQHGAVGWRMPLSGWRGAYAGDFLGWHDRARTHFDAYSTSQVTNRPQIYEHPAQDPNCNMARAEKRWGTPMYSDGYICRNPGRNDQMHHYDMNLCYIDELLWHLQWTGDLEYARRIWPLLKLSLAWEKRNFDPDDDGLYDAYCCIWASDALYYNSGAVTHSSAYNYRANHLGALIAERIGEDPSPYQQEADKILAAINSELWLKDKGVWAEYRDFMGNRMIHDHPGLWTVYHAIDSDIASPEQAYAATAYVINNIPHIPVDIDGYHPGLADGEFYTISTTDWLPYAWSINNVAFAEVYHTALAFWEAGRRQQAYQLLKSAVLDGMYLGDSPGNIGQVSYYDAARGECYRDFADPVGVLSRAVVQGLFGFTPDALNRRVHLRPGWPMAWEYANFTHPDFSIDFRREGAVDTYTFDLNMPAIETLDFTVEALRDRVASVKLNGQPAAWKVDHQSVGRPSIKVAGHLAPHNVLEIVWDGQFIAREHTVPPLTDELVRQSRQGDMVWMAETFRPSAINAMNLPDDLGFFPEYDLNTNYEMVDLSAFYNADVTDIFRNQYLSPRSPYTTLQLPSQGVGEWCHPNDSAYIDDSALRAADGCVEIVGIPFFTPSKGHNVIYTSLFDNYPTAAVVPLHGMAKSLNLLMAGSTNHMQCYVENVHVEVVYADGTSTEMRLIPPYNWCPIEQDYYVDGKAFSIPGDRPFRFSLKDGVANRYLGDALNIDGVYGRRIDGGAATLLGINLNPYKELKELRFSAVANDVVAGLIAATYNR